MYIECTSERAYRGKSLGIRMAHSVNQRRSGSDLLPGEPPQSDNDSAVAEPGNRRPPIRDRGSVSRQWIPLSLSSRPGHWPTARRFFVPEWEQSAPDDAGGCCVYLRRVVSPGGALTPRAAAFQSRLAEPTNVLPSRPADHFAYATFRCRSLIIVNPYREAGSASVTNSVFQI
jgi:hypothetical protein